MPAERAVTVGRKRIALTSTVTTAVCVCVLAHARACARACVHACARMCACVMCLQYTIIIFDPG